MKFLMSVVVFLHFSRKKKKVTILTTGGKRKASLFLSQRICWFRCKPKMQVEYGKCFLKAEEEVILVSRISLLRKTNTD